MMIVLAGGIGSGKSIVARILRLKGYGVFDCDLEARNLMENDPSLRDKLCDLAGKDIYTSAGKLDRSLLASRLFGDISLRKKINHAVHSAVRTLIECWLEESCFNIFVETAIPAESGIADCADMVWMVEASAETKMARVKNRDNRSEGEIKRIMDAQAFEEGMLKEKGILTLYLSNNEGDTILNRIDLLLQKHVENIQPK